MALGLRKPSLGGPGAAKTSAEMRIPSVVLLCGVWCVVFVVCDTAIETKMRKILEESTLRDRTKRKSLSTVCGVLLCCCVLCAELFWFFLVLGGPSWQAATQCNDVYLVFSDVALPWHPAFWPSHSSKKATHQR